jgi:terminase small subunit-like protein
MSDEELKPLSKKHQRFVDEYLKCFNATQAYLVVYPSSTRDAARANAARLIATDSVKAEITTRLAEVHMSADEALKLTADIARGDLADFMAIGSMGFSLDLDAAREAGKTNLIRKVSQKTIIDGKTDKETHILDIELYDRQAALRDVLKLHGKFTERVDVTSQGDKIGSDDVRSEILGKLARIATATGADQLPRQPDE